jgi:tripartite-type tricarboxylate transporter receptor subunit TctC
LQKKLLVWLAVCLVLISIIIGGCTEMSNKAVTATNKFPEKPITMTVGFSVGGGADLLARSLEKLSVKYLGQPLVVVNKPGGAGMIGWNDLVDSSPDGYTIGISSSELILLPLYGQTRYHYLTALEPIVQISNSPIVMLVKTDQPWQNVHEFIEYAKQHPGQLKFGHAGIGSLPHVAGEAFAKIADINIDQVPFSGASESTAALLGNHIQIAFMSSVSVKGQIKNGSLRALAVSSEHRLTDPDLTQISTFKEQGLDLVFNSRHGVAAPKGLPPDVKIKLAEGFKAMISDPEFKISMDSIGVEVEYLEPKEFKNQWLADNSKFSKIVQETGILDLIKGQKN